MDRDKSGKTIRIKRKQAFCLLLFLPLAALLFFGTLMGALPVYASQEEAARTDVDMKVTYGFQEYVKRGRYVPVYITLTSAREAFEGKIQVLTMEASREYYLYEHPVSIEAGATIEENLNIPLSVSSDIFYIKLLDEHGEEVASKRLKMNCEKDIAEIFVGVLSDSPQSLEYWNNVSLTANYSYLKTRAFYLEQPEIPDSAMEMDLLDLILITDFDAGQLTKAQAAAIEDWVNRGGTLILGTGDRAEGVLDVFVQDYLEEPYGDAQLRTVSMGVEFATFGPGDADLQIPCVDLLLNQGTVLSESDDFALLTSIPKGQGKLVVASFDYSDISDFASRQSGYVDKTLTRLFSENTLQDMYQETVFGGMGEYWDVQNMLGNFNMDRLPNVPLYIVVIIIYVLIVGPGLYLILRHYDRSRYFRISVVLCALLCTGLIYGLGQRTRFREPFYSYVTVLDQDGIQIHDQTYMNIRAPFNQPYSVSVDRNYQMTALTQTEYSYSQDEAAFTGAENFNVSISYGEENTQMSIQDTLAFTPKIFGLERSYDSQWGNGLNGELTLYDGGAKGYVFNQTDYDLENVSIILYGNVVYVGDLPKNEKKDLEDCTVTAYSSGYHYNVAGKITGGSKFKTPEVGNEDYLKALSRTNVLTYYISNYFSSYTEDAKLIGFMAGEQKPGFVLNEDYSAQGVTMLCSNIQVENFYEGRIYRPLLKESPVVVNGSYESRLNATFGSDPVTLEYSLGNDLEIEKVDFNLSSVVEEDESKSYNRLFKGKMYFYNYETDSFDEKSVDQKSFYDYELRPYLSPANNLMVRYINENESEYQWDILLPVLSVVGREK